VETIDPKFVEIYRARNLPQAHMIRMALAEAGIETQIEGELLQGAVGDLPIGWPTAPRILVAESQADTARQIIERAEERQGSEPEADESREMTRCLACDAVMVEGDPKCPRCGWSYEGGDE